MSSFFLTCGALAASLMRDAHQQKACYFYRYQNDLKTLTELLIYFAFAIPAITQDILLAIIIS